MTLTLKGGSRPPWVGLGAAVWVQIASGNTFTFPLYSHSLKSVLGFNQRQVTLLGVANDIGENVGLLPGIACNKFPPWLILCVGAFASFIGYGVLWLAVSQTLTNLPYLLLWFALVIATNSSAWLTTAVLVTNMRNFPVSRGKVAGILKGYGGLSAAVFTEIYSLLLHNSSSTFLLFLAIGIPVVCFCMMFLVRPCTPALDEDSTSNSHFIFIQCSSVVLGVYLLATTIFGNLLSFSVTVSYILVAVMIFLLMAPIAVPIKMTLYPKSASNSEQQLGSSDSLGQGKDDKIEPLLGSSSTGALGSSNDQDNSSEIAMLLALGEGAIKQKKRKPKRGEDFKFTEAIVKADFWLLFFVYFVGVGTGVTVLNNLAQIGIAQGEEDTTTLLSIFSFCNFVGRLGGGVVSEHFVRTKLIPRTFWLTCTQTVMLLVYLLFAFAVNGTLYPAVAFLGVCYGVQVSIMIPTTSELFGLKNFGVFSNIMSLGNPLGATLFSALLAGSIYDKEAAKQHGINLLASGVSCVGASCFKLTFFILSGVCAAGIILSIILTLRIKPVYQMLYAGGSFRLPQTTSSR
ncbi:putative major facilitator superfamily domain-containing protein [Medicago truncatula]|uniref:Nodulin-like/MFS transporter n=1 Tax=Medicago truncatula TaxID=3880 RepID=A0A072V983_MEDTR|nr:protein NUCLEAR FUSION DEFECTIVE 4 [Medicago truncatula]KEH37893.1 nodulin-like/MFS transporter [Medicago truncatula]RHN73977.1 putative major facilitator superfamily domain-containing protein [Medicago truncatula]